ncbi:hypothetical protein [Pseudodesulfovibrio pelocollis]|uniref:VirB4 family type IV secretion/conjugal transfer ATPase n=1 Tax=Pseudodesulfovibrio pelocollis TaxID=3051432 RepID=UPI00255B222B|nr:hypothetical protein [Pseudodesulfovibrio sp. SB368]
MFENYISMGAIVGMGFFCSALVLFLGIILPKIVRPDPHYKKFTNIYKKFIVSHVDKDGLITTQDGRHAQMIEVLGRNFKSIDPDVAYSILTRRIQWLGGMPTEVSFMIQSHRHTYSASNPVKFNKLSNFVQKIYAKWNSNFISNFRSRHYILFIADNAGTLDKVEGQFKGKEQKRHDSLIALKQAIKQTKDRLGAEYEIRDMCKAKVFSYLSSLLQGRTVKIKPSDTGYVEGLISGTDLYWPENKRYQEYLGATKRYSAWLSFTSPNAWTQADTITDLFSLEIEFSLYQTCRRLDRQAALLKIKDFQLSLGSSSVSTTKREDEFETLTEEIEDTTNMFEYRFSIEVFGDDLKELEQSITTIQRRIEHDGYLVKREDLNQEPLFWSKFPGSHTLNPRVHYPTTENIAVLCSFPARVKGLSSCSFGNMPWTQFKTEEGDAYTFIPHVDESDEALGNMMIIGGAGKGKTTLISFLINCCFKYENFRAICFDRLNGMEVFTRMVDGVYFLGEDVDRMGMNPLQLSNSAKNKSFLAKWMSLILGVDEEKDKQQFREIDDTIKGMFDEKFPKEDRTLEQFSYGIGHSGLELRDALDPWLEGGSNGAYFSSKEDSLSFTEHSLVAFDMTDMLERESLLGPFLYYLFHKVTIEAEGDPFVMFVDEAPAFFRQEMFQPKAKVILDEFRKKNGVGIFAGQNASDFTGQWFAESFKKQIATSIFFPDPKANRSDYVDQFGLNEREFRWIKEFKPAKGEHYVLVKRQSGESVVLNVSLACLGDYLHIFNSSARAAKVIRGMYEKNPDGFKEEYLEYQRKRSWREVPEVEEAA